MYERIAEGLEGCELVYDDAKGNLSGVDSWGYKITYVKPWKSFRQRPPGVFLGKRENDL